MFTRKKLVVLTSLFIVLLLIAGCSSGTKTTETTTTTTKAATTAATTAVTTADTTESNMVGNMFKTGLPIVEEKVTLNFVTLRHALHTKDFAEMEAVKYFEEKTNVHIEWEEIANTGWEEKVNLLFAGGDLPDVFFSGISNKNLLEGGQQGTIIPLDDLIDQWGPNIKKFLAERPDIKKSITAPDRKIYALFSLDEGPWLKSADNQFINKTWLDKLNLNVPTTIDEFYNVLKAFKTMDPNGNGKPDEIPFTFISNSSSNYLGSLFGSFGILDNSMHISIKDGEVIFVPIQPEYLEGLKYFNKLMNEGLMDQEGFTQNESQFTAKGKATDMILGSFVAFILDNHVGPERVDDYTLLLPLKGPKGVQMWNSNTGIAGFRKNFFTITSNNKYPEITMRWIDNIMDVGDNSITITFGPENLGWTKNTDGTWSLITTNLPNDMPYGQFRHTISPGNAALTCMDGVLNGKRKLDERTALKLGWVNSLQPFFPKEVYSTTLYYPIDIQDELAVLENDITTYVEQMQAQFIIDGVDTAEWDSYISNLNQMGLERLIKIYQDTYNNLK